MVSIETVYTVLQSNYEDLFTYNIPLLILIQLSEIIDLQNLFTFLKCKNYI